MLNFVVSLIKANPTAALNIIEALLPLLLAELKKRPELLVELIEKAIGAPRPR